MASILPGFEYDIFLSYRHNDNLDGWVTEFVQNLEKELRSTLKETVTVYFDKNPHDGLLESHTVDKSLGHKLKSLLFIPIVSQTYCDPKSFAWQHEFCAFNKLSAADQFGSDVQLSHGNVTSRVLPIKIHDVDAEDQRVFENEIGSAMRAIEFIFKSSGVNRPLTLADNPEKNLNKTLYRDQINKVANIIKEILHGLKNAEHGKASGQAGKSEPAVARTPIAAELNRRSVLRASLVYILLAGIVWKLTAIAADMSALPEASLRIASIALILLFPVSVLLSWLYERSPKGFIRSGSASSMNNPFGADQKKPFTSNTTIALLTVTVVALFLLLPSNSKSAGGSSDVDPSVAVLPFHNLSGDPSQEYVSDGIMEAILNHLAKIEGIRLTSRTTMITYKGTKKNAREIAKEVGVRYVLEGSVQRVENTIRISAQLIDGSNDNHVWSEYYDRKIADLLAIQSEVAQQIAAKLKINIKPDAKANIETKATLNAEAYDLFLRAYHLFSSRDSGEMIQPLLERAIKLDPNFSSAYAILGWHWMTSGNSKLSARDVINMAEPLLNKALSLNPNEVFAHNGLGCLSLWYKWDFYTAEREFNYSAQLEPGNLGAKYMDIKIAMGKFKEAVQSGRERIKAEPKNVYYKIDLGFGLYFDGKYEESALYLDSAVDTASPVYPSFSDLGRTYLYLGPYDKVIKVTERGIKSGRFISGNSPRNQAVLTIALFQLNKLERAQVILDELKSEIAIGPTGSPAFYTAMVCASRGEIDQAFHYLDQSFATHEVEMYWLKVEPPFKSLYKDPRWQVMLDKVGFPRGTQ